MVPCPECHLTSHAKPHLFRPVMRASIISLMRSSTWRSSRATALRLLLDQQRNIGIFLEAVSDSVKVQVEGIAPRALSGMLAPLCCRGWANTAREQVGFGDSGGKELSPFAPSRRRPPNESIRIAVAIRKAVRFPVSDGLSFVRLSSDSRRARAFAPIRSCSSTGWEICLLSDLLEERETNFGVVGSEHLPVQERSSTWFLSFRSSKAGCQEAECSAGSLEIGNRGPLLSHYVDQGRMKRIGGAYTISESERPSSSACRSSETPLA